MDICKKFGKNIKKYRKKNGITQEELSNISGLHRNYISDVELGKRSISLKNIEVLSISLNIEITNLFKFEE
ncbi:helix-turn-helix domain-containing protein [Ursidibacter arcticus]